MAIRSSRAAWQGSLPEGNGTIYIGRGAFEAPYSFASRFEEGGGTNPEELIAAAHAGCYSMAFAHGLSEAGYAPIRVETSAHVHLEKAPDGFAIPRIDLETEADVPNIDEDAFQRLAETAKQDCPVSKLLGRARITLNATLLSAQRK